MEIVQIPSIQNNSNRVNNGQKIAALTTLAKVGSRRPKRRKAEGKMRMFKHFSPLNQITRMMRTHALALSVDASGHLLINTSVQSNAVTGSTDWSSISVEFQQYRVKRVSAILVPTQTSSNATTTYQSAVYSSRFWGLAPTTITNMTSEPSFSVFSTLQEFRMENNWLGFPESHEWVNVGTSIPQEASYGMAFIGPTNITMIANSIIFSGVAEFEVEFSGTY